MPCIYYKRHLCIYIYIYIKYSFSFEKFFHIRYLQFCSHVSISAHKMPFDENTIFSTHDARCLSWIDFSITLGDRSYHVALTAKLYSERACRATMMNVEERRRGGTDGFTLGVSGARRKLYVNRLMERRFGYNWISLVRYCKYWQPGKLPTQ